MIGPQARAIAGLAAREIGLLIGGAFILIAVGEALHWSLVFVQSVREQ